VPRLPQHGFADKRTRAIGDITAAQIEAAANDAAGLARGLGKRVAAGGLSLGATMALWLAQTGAADNAVAIAPFLMVPMLPRKPGMLFMHLLHRLPNAWMWWDPRVKERVGPPYAYPGFWTHCLTQCTFAGEQIFAAAAQAAPAAPQCTIVVNAHDPAISNAAARDLARTWRNSGAHYDYTVWSDLGKRHDVIDLTTFPDASRLVYPRLAALLNKVPPSQS
jgi:acetyl esterase/lipase